MHPLTLTPAAPTNPTTAIPLTTQLPTTTPAAPTNALSNSSANASATADAQAPTGPDALAALLAEAPPTAGPLDELEFDRLSPAGRLDAVLAWERLLRHAHAGLFSCLGALTRDMTAEGWVVESELCAALAWSPSAAQTRLGEADALTRLFPDTLQLLSDGRIALDQARCLAQLTFGLPDTTATAVQAHVLPRMPGQTNAATRQAVRRAILRTDPEAAERRHRHERTRRRVELCPEDDGMATLSFYLPAEVAQMAMRTLTALAQSAKRKNPTDPRTLDQHRADLLPALLTHTPTTGTPHTPAHINVVVGIETLLGLSRESGHLTGHGPLTAEQTRQIAHEQGARWRFLLTADNGTLAETSRTYTPRAALQHFTRLMHTTCAFPHCAMPAERCDLDHNQPYDQGGPTTPDNLAPLCRRHHNGKTRGHWKLTRHEDTITWTSTRTGRSYNTTATRYQPTPIAG